MHQRYVDTAALLSTAQASPSLRPPPNPPPLHHPPTPPPPAASRQEISINFLFCFFFVPSSSSSPPSPSSAPEKRRKKGILFSSRRSPSRPQKGGWDGCEHGFGSGSSALTLRRNRCASGQEEGAGGARQVLDEAAAHECSCQNVCVSSPVMTC